MKYPGQVINFNGGKPDPQMDWFERAAKEAGFQEVIKRNGANPCVNLYGPGPVDVRCKACRLLIRHECSKTYFKCELRGFTHGPATDHRANWPACGRFVPV